MRHSQELSGLELSEQEAGLNPGVSGEKEEFSPRRSARPEACPLGTHVVLYVRIDMLAKDGA
jgi:hypothetical protein